MHTVPAKSIPWVRRLFPSYKRRDVDIVPCERVTFTNLNWSGGTRREYALVRLDDLETRSFAAWNQMAPWDNPAEGMTVPMRPGFAVVRTGHFCGKPSLMKVYVHPTNVAPLLTHT